MWLTCLHQEVGTYGPVSFISLLQFFRHLVSCFLLNLRHESSLLCFHNKLRLEMKSTTQLVGYFETISGHFFGNYINISHKTEVLTVFLMCLTYLNPYLIKNYDIKHNFCHFCFFQFCKKKSQLTNGYFMTISGHFLPTT